MPVVHSVGISMGIGSAVGIGSVIVRNPGELAIALKQRQKPVVIVDVQMAQRFRSIEGWQEARIWFFGSLVAALLAFAIAQNYKIEMSWHRDWKVNSMDGKVTLTPILRK
jgi:hypothetical protein